MGFFVPGDFMPAGSCPLAAVAVCLCSGRSRAEAPGNTQICCWWSWAVGAHLGKERLNQRAL